MLSFSLGLDKKYGGTGPNPGSVFDDSQAYDADTWGAIKEIKVYADSLVTGVNVLYAGGLVVGYGSSRGTEHTISLGANEYITQVAGRSGWKVDQLKFVTNQGQTFGPYGGNGGGEFAADFGGKALVAFFGQAEAILSSIGFHSIEFASIPQELSKKLDAVYRNTRYIQSLHYDLDRLLAIDLQPSSQPVYKDREHTSNKVIICTKKQHGVAQELDEHVLLDPSGGVIFPGAVIKQDRTLAERRPTPYTLPRSSLTLHVDLPGIQDSIVTVESPTNVMVPATLSKAVEEWLDNIQSSEGFQTPVRAFGTSRKAYTKEQIGIELGFGAQWSNNTATAALQADSTTETTYVYRAFRQIYYSVYVQEPEQAGELFADIELNSLTMPASSPPGLVRSVDYGRIILVKMATNSRVTEQEAEFTLDYATGGVETSSELHQRYEGIAKESSFQALVIGGGTGSAELLSGDYTKIAETITQGIEFSKQNPAYPISYKVADLKTRELSAIKTTTNYVETVCEEKPDRSITMKHRGGYVAKFWVEWKENNGNGGYDKKSWDTGRYKKTNPWDHTLSFPGDAQDFIVTAENDTGLFWDKHRRKSVRYGVLDGDKTVTISGTTLNMKISG